MIGAPSLWSVTDYLLAHAIDHLAAANIQRSGKKGRFKPFPRPERNDQKAPALPTGAELTRRLLEMQKRHGGPKRRSRKGVTDG